MSRSAPEPDRPNVTAPGEENAFHGARRQPVPLDAPDVALRGKRLLAYGERLRREEVETVKPADSRTQSGPAYSLNFYFVEFIGAW